MVQSGLFCSAPKERRQAVVDFVGEPLRYSVIMEPTQQNWLFGLRHATPDRPGIFATPDFRLYSLIVVEDDFRYTVESWPEARLEVELSPWRREVELRLPEDDNQSTREWALARRAEVASDGEFVGTILEYFNREPFVYTLKPPLLPDQNSVDAFLFETRRGFCEHYAAAFVVLMRAAGVPARVVAGYQGGEVNPVNKTVIVHQFDAHAWTEVWLAGKGWVRVDPTAAVAPQRIEMGLEDALAEEGTFLAESPLSPLRYRSIRWLNQLRLRYDALTYRWQSWVVGFDGVAQVNLLRDFLGDINAGRFAAVFIGSWVVLLLPVALGLFRRRDTKPLSKIDRGFLKVCERLAALGYPRLGGETASQYAERVGAECPAWSQRLTELSGLYTELAYSTPSKRDEKEIEQSFIGAARAFRPRLRDLRRAVQQA